MALELELLEVKIVGEFALRDTEKNRTTCKVLGLELHLTPEAAEFLEGNIHWDNYVNDTGIQALRQYLEGKELEPVIHDE